MNDAPKAVDILGNDLNPEDFFIDVDDYYSYGRMLVIYSVYKEQDHLKQRRYKCLKESDDAITKNTPTIFNGISVSKPSHLGEVVLPRIKLPLNLVKPKVRKQEIKAYLGLCGYPVEIDND